MDYIKPNVGWRIKALKNTQTTQSQSTTPESITVPAVPGASSVMDTTYQSLITVANRQFNIAQGDFDRQWLLVLEYLAVFHSETSAAVDNIVRLANTDFTIDYGADAKAKEVEKWTASVDTMLKKVYMGKEGARSMCSDLIAQIAINGALSVEKIPNKNLTGIERVVRVRPYSIELGIDKDTQDIQAFQRPSNYMQRVMNTTAGLIVLNPNTYTYMGIRRYSGSLYGVPPFLSAMDTMVSHKEMLLSIKAAMRKVGLFGILSVMYRELKQKPNENERQFEQRSIEFIRAQQAVVEKVNKDGSIVGFKEQHELDLKATPQNLSGIKPVFEVIESTMIAGMKQDPNLMGRRTGTTETFGNVILKMLKSSIYDYQSMVATFLEDLILTHLLLQGFTPKVVTVKFAQPSVQDELKEADVLAKKAAHGIMLRNEGIWSQTQASMYITGQKPFIENVEPKEVQEVAAPVPEPTKENGTNPEIDKESNERPSRYLPNFLKATTEARTQMLANAVKQISRGTAEYQYCEHINCGTESFAKDDRSKYADNYFNKIDRLYKQAIKKFVAKLKPDLLKMSDSIPLSELQDVVSYTLLKEWDSLFVTKIKPVNNTQSNDIYKHYRNDKSVLAGKMDPIPKVNLNLKDYRAIEHNAKVDNFYMGKFVTDKDTALRLRNTIKDVYLEKGAPVGKNEAGIKALQAKIGDTMAIDSFKLRRIADTTVNRLRAHGNVNYMAEAGVETYELVEVMDRITCPHCQVLNGKTFSLTDAESLVTKMSNYEDEEFSKEFPFAVTRSKDDLEAMTNDQLVAAGFIVPPFHPFCRGRLVMA